LLTVNSTLFDGLFGNARLIPRVQMLYPEFMFKTRSSELELIDTGDYTPAEYEGFLREIRLINRWLGDVDALRNTLMREIEQENLPEFSILDVGAGSGELLRVAAKWARKQNKTARFVGLELNERSACAILEESRNFREIESVRSDALRLPFSDGAFDYAICSLFTHHFADENVIKILREMRRVARRKIYAIDLHRDPVAYFFYTTIGKIFLHNRLVRHDGALSILRSFVPEELENLGAQAGLRDISVTKHFPARLVLQGKS
jgi:ubiquinone/menaquinone biosynthesis C-methylase UbiE